MWYNKYNKKKKTSDVNSYMRLEPYTSSSKYHNKKCISDGHNFASKAEMRRYEELKLLVRAKEISNLELQPKFLLQDSFRMEDGKLIRKLHYVGDFMYTEKDGKVIVEDVKGIETDHYKIKKKLFLYKITVQKAYKVDKFVEIKK